MTRAEILDRAKECVTGKRHEDYGSPEDNFTTIARLWTDYCGYGFSAKDVAMMMALLKIARIKGGGGSGDSYVDLAGYAACAGEINSRQEKSDPASRPLPLQEEIKDLYDIKAEMSKVTDTDLRDYWHKQDKFIEIVDKHITQVERKADDFCSRTERE